MAKIGERYHEDGRKLIVETVTDQTQTLQLASDLRSAGAGDHGGEHKLVGIIPGELIEIWAKEAGVKFDDPALKDVIKRKLLSGDFSKLRIWEGTY